MTIKVKHRILTILIATIWLVNGLFCKVLNLVPRHQEIVRSILGLDDYNARLLTILIGISEVLMSIWIYLQIKSKLNAVVQIVIIATMNLLEFILVPEVLLWGRMNSIFALILIGTIYYNEFVLNKKPEQ